MLLSFGFSASKNKLKAQCNINKNKTKSNMMEKIYSEINVLIWGEKMIIWKKKV